MSASSAWLAAAVRSGVVAPVSRARRLAGDAGEGVISVAIAVLIMALLGAAMWSVFNVAFDNMNTNTETKMNCIADDLEEC